ncbi:baseplate J/gp47 family protein [Natrialbaceae archaeon GCM10025810]|uniref:baseplate J/gp47 family protein n=1 Tax=Halovalidus salilacus TaxID=3075124 RepID=UPI00361263EC
MTIVDGHFQPESSDDIIEALLEDAKEYFGEDLNDEQLAVFRLFYQPVANRLAEAQEHIGLVLSSAQIDYAEGQALDLLTALIGVPRREAQRAEGEVTFSRNSPATTDYSIPRGTLVQTEGIEPVRFLTMESGQIPEGETEVTVPIRALYGGVEGNVGSNTITVMPSPPIGVDSVTNEEGTSGGRDEESDDELRERAKEDLAEGSASTAPALVTGIRSVDGVRSVGIFINDTNVDHTDEGGLPAHSFELVVDGGEDQDIGDMILEKKAAGDTSWGGVNGDLVEVESRLPNGQTYDVKFSRPIPVPIYVEATIETTDEYEGDDAVRDSITSYIGGTLTSEHEVPGEVDVGEDVLFGKVEYAIRSVRGVYDVTDLKVDTSEPPEGTSNITMDYNERALISAVDDSITINHE